MKINENKTVPSKTKKQIPKLSWYLFIVNLLVSPVIFTNCKTTQTYIEGNYTTSNFYLDTDSPIYRLYNRSYDIDKSFILEINEPVPKLNELLSSNMVSFTTANMPIDVANILKAYKPDDNTYSDFYDYVAQNVDRIILLPNSRGSLGFVVSSYYKDIWPYESESLVYLASNYLRLLFRGESSRARNVAITIVHEAAHKELFRLIKEKKISYHYAGMSITERYALIKEIEFREKTGWYSSIVWGRLNELNRFFGLPINNREPFILMD